MTLHAVARVGFWALGLKTFLRTFVANEQEGGQGLKRMKFQLCLVAVASSPCFWALGLMMPRSDFHLTTLVSASSSYTTSHASHDDDDDIWQTSYLVLSKISWDILNKDFHAFKDCVCKLFHNPLFMMSKCEECVWLYLCGRGFPSQSFVPHQLMGISWWIVGTCTSSPDFEKM